MSPESPVELNPVRAHLVEEPGDYEWSSARFHLRRKPDGLTERGALEDEIDDWGGFLAAGGDGEARRVRKCTSTGRPLGSREFVAGLEEELGRPLAPRRPGRKPRRGWS